MWLLLARLFRHSVDAGNDPVEAGLGHVSVFAQPFDQPAAGRPDHADARQEEQQRQSGDQSSASENVHDVLDFQSARMFGFLRRPDAIRSRSARTGTRKSHQQPKHDGRDCNPSHLGRIVRSHIA